MRCGRRTVTVAEATDAAAYAVTVVVNGVPRTGLAEPRTLLSDFLRHELGLTGTHVGCEQGGCGACTVLLDGEPAFSCLALAVQADGREVTTIEGLGDEGGLNVVQRAFSEHHGLQCGFCTPGMVVATTALLAGDPDPDEATIRDYLAGNVCRCTGYVGIVAAVRAAAQSLREAAS